MPSAQSVSVVDGSVPSTAAACRTRYRYPGFDIQIDCATALVDGDAGHWVTSCNVPPGFGQDGFHGLQIPPLRYEATAEDGFFLHEQIDLASMPTNYVPWRDVSYAYDSQHRLTEISKIAPNGVDTFDLTITARDAQGKLLAFDVTGPPLTDPMGQVFPTTAHSSHACQYDDLGRLVADQGQYDDGWKFWDETIRYDDRARRRDHTIIVDDSGETHDGTGPGLNTQHEFLDRSGQLLTASYTNPGGPLTTVVYRYDDQQRVTSRIVTISGGLSSTTDYIYECQ